MRRAKLNIRPNIAGVKKGSIIPSSPVKTPSQLTDSPLKVVSSISVDDQPLPSSSPHIVPSQDTTPNDSPIESLPPADVQPQLLSPLPPVQQGPLPPTTLVLGLPTPQQPPAKVKVKKEAFVQNKVLPEGQQMTLGLPITAELLPDKSRMKMSDLLFYNPPHHPIKREKSLNKTPSSNDLSLKGEAKLAEEEAALPAPKVKIGSDGSIILDEDSLFVEARQTAADETDFQVVHETEESSRKVTERSFTTKTIALRKSWTNKETGLFYKALSILGPDFTTLTALFPKRQRCELKNKFKSEERRNPHLISKAMCK